MYLRSDENALAQSVKAAALGKGMVAREREEEGEKPTMPNNLISLPLYFFSWCFYAFTLKLMCLVDFPSCV